MVNFVNQTSVMHCV